MSTSADVQTARKYSGPPRTPGAIFQIRFDMGTRGADVQWCSQYPAEKEMLFPPYCSLTTEHAQQIGANIMLNVKATVSTMRPNVSWCVEPDSKPPSNEAKVMPTLGPFEASPLDAKSFAEIEFIFKRETKSFWYRHRVLDLAEGELSPIAAVTFTDRAPADIPENATHYAFAYPLSNVTANERLHLLLNKSLTSLIDVGGFIYFQDAESKSFEALHEALSTRVDEPDADAEVEATARLPIEARGAASIDDPFAEESSHATLHRLREESHAELVEELGGAPRLNLQSSRAQGRGHALKVNLQKAMQQYTLHAQVASAGSSRFQALQVNILKGSGGRGLNFSGAYSFDEPPSEVVAITRKNEPSLITPSMTIQRPPSELRHYVTLSVLREHGAQQFTWMPKLGPHGSFAYFYADSTMDCFFCAYTANEDEMLSIVPGRTQSQA